MIDERKVYALCGGAVFIIGLVGLWIDNKISKKEEKIYKELAEREKEYVEESHRVLTENYLKNQEFYNELWDNIPEFTSENAEEFLKWIES